LDTLYNLNEFNYIFCTDADSVVNENTIPNLVESIKLKNAVAACGIVNADLSNGNMFWTNIQNYQYLYGQYIRRTNEDLMNQVLCLPGCITMFKINEEAKNALLKFSSLPDEKNLIQRNSQYIGTDRKYTSCIIQTNKNAKIVLDTRCHVYTVPPNNWISYINQRRRWCSNMYFNSMNNVIAPNINILLRLFTILDIVRLSLVYFRLFNTTYLLYLIVITFKDQNIIRFVPLIIFVALPTFCFLVYSIFNGHLRKQYIKFLIMSIINKIFTLLSTIIVFTVMLININSFQWSIAKKDKTKRYGVFFNRKNIEDENGFMIA
jgi:chitin synthase